MESKSRQCKVCKLIVDLSKYGPRRAVCLKCSYAKNKDYLKTYYRDNRVSIIARVMEIYNDNRTTEKKPRGRPRKHLKKDLIVDEPAAPSLAKGQPVVETVVETEQEQFDKQVLLIDNFFKEAV
jgi:hypothetical protein